MGVRRAVPESNGQTPEIRYLLGTLSPAGTALIDEALLEDDAKAQELELAETDLIDAYVRNELTAADRQRFNDRLQHSPALLERVRFAEVLKDKIAESVTVVEPEPRLRPSWWQLLFAQPAFTVAVTAGFIVATGGGVTLLVALRNIRNESTQIAAERSALIEESKRRQQQATELQARADQLAAQLQQEREQRAEDRKHIEQLQHQAEQSSSQLPTSIASIFLMPGTVRSSGSRQQLTLSPATRTVRLKLSLADKEYSSYNVSVESVDGNVVAAQHRRKAHGHLLPISIPAQRLSPGYYVITVKGVRPDGQLERAGDYQFQVLQRR